MILNGDFSFTATGSDANAPDLGMGFLPQEPDAGAPDPAPAYVAIKDWITGGGGKYSYPMWGGKAQSEYATGWTPTAQNAGASLSSLYFGNAYWSYSGGPLTLDANGYTAKANGISFACRMPDNSVADPTWYGTYATPVNVSQTVGGLTVGQKYRLQFFCGGEVVEGGPGFPEPGVAGLDISGYDRVFFVVPNAPLAYYRTVDFLAKSTSHTISFLNWGHINLSRWMRSVFMF